MLLSTLLAPGAAQANFVTNGEFNTNCSGWTFGGFNNFCDTGGNPGPSLVLNDFPNIVPTASQQLSGLMLNQIYDISLDAKTFFNIANDPVTSGAGIAIDGQQFDFLVVNDQSWTPYSFSFTYGGGSQLLVLSSQRNGTDSDAQFDNVSLIARNVSASVPEPTTTALLVLGLFGAGFAWKRRTH